MDDNSISGKSEKQDELIRKYCAEADSLLAGAPDYESAVRLKDSLCKRFRSECDSSLVVAATNLYLDKVLKQRWQRK